MMILLLLLLSVFNATMLHWMGQNPSCYRLNAYTCETAGFRNMALGPGVAALDSIDFERLTGWMLENEFDLTGMKTERELNAASGLPGLPGFPNGPKLLAGNTAAYRKLSNAYAAVFSDLKYFPIPKSTREGTPDVSYEDGWQHRRTYGGERGHEGCDIMGMERERGFYPVISMSDGTVEKMGWLEKGGWRVGVRTPSGAYLYYAHLYSYADGLAEGQTVKAGQLLGYMGDSGYGKQENTVGNFDVHLHVGIYLKTDHYEEMSVNPYWVMRYLEKKRLAFDY